MNIFVFAMITVGKVNKNEKLTKGEIQFMAECTKVLIEEGEFTDLLEEKYEKGEYS